jgi:two-component system response regulator NreC
MPQKISIFIVEDHKLIADAWSSLLSRIEDFEVCGQEGDAHSAELAILEFRPDIVLMDMNLKNGSGLDVCRSITNQLPKTRVIGLSIHDEMAFVKQFFQSGAVGYLSKNVTQEELETAIRTAHNGNTYVCKEIADKQFFNMLEKDNASTQKELTNKEIEVIKLIAQGLTSQQIADLQFISRRTVEAHRHNILKKLSLHNAAQLSSYAKEKGYV